MKREIDPFTIRKGDLIRWEYEGEMEQWIAKYDQPPYRSWGKHYLIKPATVTIPLAALNALRQRISDCPYEYEDDWGITDFLNEIDEARA